MIIKYGPAASGKGSVGVTKAILGFGHELKTYINFNVDDVVESFEKFTKNSRSTLDGILRKYKKEPKNLINLLNNLSQQNTETLSKPYFDIRFNKALNIAKKSDTIMANAMNKKINITFETTGSYGFPFWLWELKGIEDYQVKFIFPLVEIDNGWRRYKARAIQSYENGKAFRFFSTKEEYKNNHIKSYTNFMENIKFLKDNQAEIIIVKNDKTKFANNMEKVFEDLKERF